jgi:predicted N-acyltransferase
MYSARIFNSIRDVPREEWGALVAGHSCAYSYEFWDVIEASKLDGFCYKHALIYSEKNSPVALASFYSLTTDMAIFSSGWLRSALRITRKIFPGFLKLRMLECGTPLTMNRPLIVKEGANEGEILEVLNGALIDIAKKQGAFVVVVRDFEPQADKLEPYLKRLDYHLVGSLPNTYLDVAWSTPSEYLSSMKSHYRRKVNIHLRLNEENGIRCELEDDFCELADILSNQWLVVHENAKEFQREKLTSEFYKEFSSKLGSRSKVLLFYRNDELVGHVLLLVDGQMLRWLYVGRKESVKDHLYFYMCYKIVETAIILQVKRLELGLTTYDPKLNLGARVNPVRLAIRTTRVPNMLTGLVYSLLNHIPEINNRNVFR